MGKVFSTLISLFFSVCIMLVVSTSSTSTSSSDFKLKTRKQKHALQMKKSRKYREKPEKQKKRDVQKMKQKRQEMQEEKIYEEKNFQERLIEDVPIKCWLSDQAADPRYPPQFFYPLDDQKKACAVCSLVEHMRILANIRENPRNIEWLQLRATAFVCSRF